MTRRLKSAAIRLFVQYLVQPNNNKNIALLALWEGNPLNGFFSKRSNNAGSVPFRCVLDHISRFPASGVQTDGNSSLMAPPIYFKNYGKSYADSFRTLTVTRISSGPNSQLCQPSSGCVLSVTRPHVLYTPYQPQKLLPSPCGPLMLSVHDRPFVTRSHIRSGTGYLVLSGFVYIRLVIIRKTVWEASDNFENEKGCIDHFTVFHLHLKSCCDNMLDVVHNGRQINQIFRLR